MTTKKYFGGFWLRFGAIVIDTCFMLVVSGMINVAFGLKFFATNSPEQLSIKEIGASLLTFVAGLLYFTIFQALMNGSFGKKVFGLMLVDAKKYYQISLGQSMARYGMQFVSMACLGLGYIWVGLHDKRQGWHDSVAGTVVIKRKHLKDLMIEEGIFPKKKMMTIVPKEKVPEIQKAA